jgi:YbgC/YbaW family acyl-CoA thioester hydrolase
VAAVSRVRVLRRVQFHETDMAGLVHFSWFFKYMEEAEHALWREAGLTIATVGEEVGFPRLAASFEFHSPLRFGDEFEIAIRIAAITRRTIRYACLMSLGETKVATGSLTIACASRRHGEPMRAIDIPEAFASRFEVAAEGRPA